MRLIMISPAFETKSENSFLKFLQKNEMKSLLVQYGNEFDELILNRACEWVSEWVWGNRNAHEVDT